MVRKHAESGFTLMEILLVIVIIGVLAAIAIPQFESFKKYSYDSRARTSLRAVATAEETYFAENEVYKSCDEVTCVNNLPGINLMAAGVTLEIFATASGFTGTSTHHMGSGLVVQWDSENGGQQN